MVNSGRWYSSDANKEPGRRLRNEREGLRVKRMPSVVLRDGARHWEKRADH